jgi:FMN phosphatase YigB (HAD superfamily)
MLVSAFQIVLQRRPCLILLLICFESEDVGKEKPDNAIFNSAFQQAQFWCYQKGVKLERDMILHIGDNFAAGLITKIYCIITRLAD